MIQLRLNKEDKEMIELFTEEPTFILWGVVHVDFLSSLANEVSVEDLTDFDYKLNIRID